MTQAAAEHSSGTERAVADLCLTAQIIVWSLRRYRAAGSGIDALVPTYRKVFGLTGVEKALAAFAAFVAAIEAHHRPLGGATDIGASDLSPTEDHVLDLLAAVEARDDRQAEAAADALVRMEGRLSTIAAARLFAACLHAAGRKVVAGASFRRPPGARLPTLERREDLTTDERLVLQGIRLWVSHLKKDRDGAEPLRELLAAYGAGNARPSFNAILYNLSVAAIRPIDVRCLTCPSVSPDEARMIHAIACSQHGLVAEAAVMLEAWLAPAAVRITTVAVSSLAAALATSYVTLPLRRWNFGRLEQLSAPAAWHAPEGAMIH